jgi:hypothetical protein
MKSLVVVLVLGLMAYVAWPYYYVWRIDQAVILDDREALGELVDLEAVRQQIKRRLNKEVDSAVGDVSNAFVDWLQDGIRRMGTGAVERLVTLEWVRQQLLSKTEPHHRAGFVDRISYAFFDRPDGFLVRIGELGEDPVHLRLSLTGTSWQVTALYN